MIHKGTSPPRLRFRPPGNGVRIRRSPWKIASAVTVGIGLSRRGGRLLNLSDLPSREDLKRGIEKWWRGGGTAVLLVDTLRREEASLVEAKFVAAECGGIADKGYRVTEDVIVRVLADFRSSNIRNGSKEDRTVKRTFDPHRCVFESGRRCPNCGEVHGHLLNQAEMVARFAEIRSLFAALGDEGLAETDRPWLKLHRDPAKRYMREAGRDFMIRQAQKRAR